MEYIFFVNGIIIYYQIRIYLLHYYKIVLIIEHDKFI